MSSYLIFSNALQIFIIVQAQSYNEAKRMVR